MRPSPFWQWRRLHWWTGVILIVKEISKGGDVGIKQVTGVLKPRAFSKITKSETRLAAWYKQASSTLFTGVRLSCYQKRYFSTLLLNLQLENIFLGYVSYIFKIKTFTKNTFFIKKFLVYKISVLNDNTNMCAFQL